MSKSPAEADHWRTVHRECRELIVEAVYQWQGGRLVDPSRPAAKAKSVRPATAVTGRASPERAAQFSQVRSEVMSSMAKARAEGDYANRMQLISLRDELTRQAQSEGLRLDDGGSFVPAT